MSAPRKIWARPDLHYATTEVRPDWPGYHHDDVVRELVKELQAALSYFDHHGITGGSVETTRAALAKIAQDA